MMFQTRNANQYDLEQLFELEKTWPEASRATKSELKRRIDIFSEGYFIAEDKTGILASIITHPYQYNPDDLSNFESWGRVNLACLSHNTSFDD